MKKALALIVWCIIYSSTFSQNIEQDIMQAIHNDLYAQNKYYGIYKNNKSMKLLINPVTGERVYSGDKNDREKIVIKLPIFPLRDTLSLIDTLNFFSSDITFQNLKVKASILDTSKSTNIILYAVGIRQNQLILSFSFHKRDLLYNYYFQVMSGKLILQKTEVLDKTVTKE